jgi:ribosomal protein S18 acetylase RimI-like enzyme
MTPDVSAAGYQVRELDADNARAIRDRLADLYELAYADKLDGAFRSRPRFLDRLDAHLARDGFAMVTAEHDGTLIGYTYGFPLPPDTGWWTHFVGELPAHVADLTRRGALFAIAELMTVPDWRRRGVARRLHDALLAGRPEMTATMLVDPTNTPAIHAYDSWGWKEIGAVQPFPDSPRFQARLRLERSEHQ